MKGGLRITNAIARSPYLDPQKSSVSVLFVLLGSWVIIGSVVIGLDPRQ